MARDFKTSRFKKTVGVTEEHNKFLEENSGKKSKAGLLEKIINYYIEHNGTEELHK